MGIDYSHDNKTNRNPDTGIRYAILNINTEGFLSEYWHDDSKPVYTDPACPYCGNEVEPGSLPENDNDDTVCPHCSEPLDEQTVYDNQEPIGFELIDSEYSLYQSADDSDLWVFKSPYTTIAGFCSPCAPGAVYLTNPAQDAEAYCLGPEWFKKETPPYTIIAKTKED